MNKVKSHLRLLVIEFFSLIFNHDSVFWLIGLVNKRIKLIKSVFLVYPANDEYQKAYTYDVRARKIEWTPWLVGFFWQNGKIGVKFAISARTEQFTNPENIGNMRIIAEKMERIRELLCAEHKTFAGILPGIFQRSTVDTCGVADSIIRSSACWH